MSTYRVGTHHGVTICREDDDHRCDRPGHDCARGHLVAVVVNGDVELAGRICALLNADDGTTDVIRNLATVREAAESLIADRCTNERQSPHRAGSRPNMCATCSEASAAPASTCEGCNRARQKSGRTCPRHGAVI